MVIDGLRGDSASATRPSSSPHRLDAPSPRPRVDLRQALDGQVRMDRNLALTEAEVAQGFVLCCQSHPLTASVTITLDER
jgi:hypothetical protein